jgi:thiamine-phosphate pyrophosphorylase
LPLVEAAARLSPAKPWFAIGGIDAARLPEVLNAGARRIVVVRAITAASDPRAAADQLRSALAAAS